MPKSNPIIKKDGAKRWYNENGDLHRLDGPAIIYSDGTKYWYRNGRCYRTDGPAIIYPGGFERWFIKGREIKPIPDHIILWERKLDAKK